MSVKHSEGHHLTDAMNSVSVVRALCGSLREFISKRVNVVTLGKMLAQTEGVQGKIGYDIKLRATECFGILHPNVTPLHDRALFRWFLSHYASSKVSTGKVGGVFTKEGYWKSIIQNMLHSPGLATEVFLLYALLERQSIYKKRHGPKKSMRHFQTPVVFDGANKMDLVTQLFSADHSRRHNVGIQITTTHHGKFDILEPKESLFSERIGYVSSGTDRFSPQSGCFLVINNVIGRVNADFPRNPSKARQTPYEIAFHKWAQKGYESEGPLKHLSKKLHDNYRLMAEIYEHAFEQYRHYLFDRTPFSQNGRVNFPIGKVYCKCIYNKKKHVYKLSYYQMNPPGGIPGKTKDPRVQELGEFLASFHFYPPSNRR